MALILPKVWTSTGRQIAAGLRWNLARKVPLAALTLIASVGSFFVLESVFFGWAIGVMVRARTVLAAWLALAVGALNLQRQKPPRDIDWAAGSTRRRLVVPDRDPGILGALLACLSPLPIPPLQGKPFEAWRITS